jgi:hypothetical protein
VYAKPRMMLLGRALLLAVLALSSAFAASTIPGDREMDIFTSKTTDAATSRTLADCVYKGKVYFEGIVIAVGKHSYQCRDNRWWWMHRPAPPLKTDL